VCVCERVFVCVCVSVCVCLVGREGNECRDINWCHPVETWLNVQERQKEERHRAT